MCGVVERPDHHCDDDLVFEMIGNRKALQASPHQLVLCSTSSTNKRRPAYLVHQATCLYTAIYAELQRERYCECQVYNYIGKSIMGNGMGPKGVCSANAANSHLMPCVENLL